MERKEVLQTMDVIIVDAYGVFNFGKGVSPAVINTMKQLVDEGKQVYILSNTTAVNSSTIKKYEEKGVVKGVHYTDIFTSGQFASEEIQAGNLPVAGKRYYVYGIANHKNSDKVPAIFANSGYELTDYLDEADFIYCGIPQLKNNSGEFVDCKDDSYLVRFFAETVKSLVASEKPLVCVNPDKIANEGGRFVIRQGTIAEFYELYNGQVIYYGKPDPRIFETLISRYCPDISKDKILMVGDTLRTDIKGAQLAGIKTALVLQGSVTEYEMNKQRLSLEEYLAKEGIYPNYIWKRLSHEYLF